MAASQGDGWVTTVVLLIVAGSVLLMLELFLPGMIAGIGGGVCLVAAVVVAFTRTDHGWMVLALILIGGAVATMAWLAWVPRSFVGRRFVLEDSIGDANHPDMELLDQVGVARTDLRPAGVAVINGRRLDVVAESGMVEKGAEIKVVAVDGIRVVVRAE